MKIIKSKKGVIFSLLAILLSTMFVLVLTGGLMSGYDSNLEFNRARANTVNEYYSSFKDYSKFAYEISAKACMHAITEKMVNESYFYPTLEDFYNDTKHCMLTGNVSHPSEAELKLEPGLRVDELFEVLTNLTEEEYKINTKYNINSIEITEYSPSKNIYPDDFRLIAKTKVDISDDYIKLEPSEFQTIIYVTMNGLYDPYYSINKSLSLEDAKRIKDIVVIGKNDDYLRGLTFTEFLNKVDYVQSSEGISFRNRIINDSSKSNAGLIFFLNESINYVGSYVDIHYMNDTFFPTESLYCDKSTGSCSGNFQIDTYTLSVMETRYDLDVSDWERI